MRPPRRKRRPLPADTSVRIETLAHDGRGVTHVDGKATFVHAALPDELVRIRYLRVARDHDEAEVLEVVESSPDRVMPRCPHFGTCGGCSLQHLAPEAQIRGKQEVLLEALQRIGHVTPEQVLAPLTADEVWGYRRKARLGVKYVAKKQRVLVGFRERGSGFIADIDSCPVLHPQVGSRLTALAELVSGLSIRQQLPQIEVAMDDDHCALVFRVLEPPTDDDLHALRAFSTDHDFDIFLQPGGPDSITPLTSIRPLVNRLPAFDVALEFGPSDFTQVNTELNRQMIDRAMRLLQPQPEDDILDLFCGIGNFTLPIARSGARVVGVEADAELLRRASVNADANGLAERVAFHAANLYEPLAQQPWLAGSFAKALLDPPRSGAFEVLQLLSDLGVERIVYVSCYPGTLARDTAELVGRLGYRLRAAGVMDMFPHTAHVESMALFER
jgi:23S rRNA (uracil1939-C5)-methyltransferase